jgi:hypothetical protein
MASQVLVELEGVRVTDFATYKEAIEGHFREQWIQAMKEELGSPQSNRTWEHVSVPLSDCMKRLIESKWVIKTKLNPDDSVRFMAHPVIKGYQQREGVDFTETYAPVSRSTTL